MANTHSFSSRRWTEGETTAADWLNNLNANADHLHEALNAIMDTTEPQAGIFFTTDNPLRTKIGTMLIQLGFWMPAAANALYLIGRAGTYPDEALSRDNAMFGFQLMPIDALNLPAS